MSTKAKSESTANDGLGKGKGRKLSPEQMAKNDEFDLGPHMIRLYWEEPFFSTIYRHVHRFQDRKIVPTAGVAVINERPTLLWNPDFLVTLTGDQIKGLLKHEAYHLIYNHVAESRRRDPHIIWNWAGDLSINGSIPAAELPEGGLIPGKEFSKPSPEDWAEMTQEEKDRFEKLSSLIGSFPVGEVADWYFYRLMENEAVKDMCKEIADAEKAGKDLAEAIGKALAAAAGGMDDHGQWGKNLDENGNSLGPISDGVKQLLEGELKEALRDAVQKADSSNSWGSVPAYMQGNLRAMVSSEVNWRSLLRQFVGMSRRSNSRSSRKKINRKVPDVFPGRSRNYTANIAVYVDQSGSVDDESLALAYGELRGMSRRTTFHFYPFDTSVDEENGFVWKKGQNHQTLGRFRCGGTDFQACVDHLNKNPKLDGAIIISDGECGKPTTSRKRMAYVIVPGRKLFFQPDSNVVVIQMTGDKKKAQ
jgi:predicted metal-dependent peptidase|tara:strand:- start:2534 stop:3961 length:1428 start_codon:yes stop_codon:yes gene_type:complete